MLQAALIASSLLGDLPREALRIAGALVLLVLASVLVVVIAVAALAATLLTALPGVGGPEPHPIPPEHVAFTSGVSAADAEFMPTPPPVPTASAGAAS